MTTNIVCSDTYIDAFSRLDKKTQKKSLETIRLMQRSLRSDGLKVEKLNTKLDFKSVRVTQDFRAIFTQAGNTVLLVYIDHHDNAYLWASKKLQGFDTASAKPVFEYFQQAKTKDFDTIDDESINSATPKLTEPSKNQKFNSETKMPLDTSGPSTHNQSDREICTNDNPAGSKNSFRKSFKKILFALVFFLLGSLTGIIFTIGYFM